MSVCLYNRKSHWDDSTLLDDLYLGNNDNPADNKISPLRFDQGHSAERLHTNCGQKKRNHNSCRQQHHSTAANNVQMSALLSPLKQLNIHTNSKMKFTVPFLFLFVGIFVKLKRFRSSNKFEYQLKITQMSKYKMQFVNDFNLLREKKLSGLLR